VIGLLLETLTAYSPRKGACLRPQRARASHMGGTKAETKTPLERAACNSECQLNGSRSALTPKRLHIRMTARGQML